MAAIISVIPILLLFILMMGLKMSGWKSALITLVVTILLALFAAPALGIVPEKYAGASIYGIAGWSVVEGFLKACFPIILIIICAIFSYNILVETKEIETIKTQFIQLTSDKGLRLDGLPDEAGVQGTFGSLVVDVMGVVEVGTHLEPGLCLIVSAQTGGETLLVLVLLNTFLVQITD